MTPVEPLACLAVAAAGAVAALLPATRTIRRLRASLRELARSARAIEPDRGGGRFPVRPAGDDLAEIVGDLNDLLERGDERARTLLEFAGNVAHEFKSPVSTMLAEVHLLRIGGTCGPEALAFLARAEVELRHLGLLIDDLLLLARAEAGAEPREVVHVGDVVRSAARRCAEAAERKDVRIDVHCPATDARSDPFVIGNGGLLQILVENLVRNAVQHSPRGAPVSLDVHRDPGTVRVVVRDAGPGIPEESRGEVFRRGERAAIGPGGSGSGLGLAIAASIVRLHGGRLVLARSDAGGCAFTAEFPATGLPLPRRASIAPPLGAPTRPPMTRS